MKKQAIELHKIYAVKVGNEVVPVRLDSENPHGGWSGTNAKSGKTVRVKSAQRLRGLWPKKTLPIIADQDDGKADDKGVAETVAAVEKGNLAEGVTVPEATKRRKAAKDTTVQPGRDTGEPDATGAQTTRPSLLNLAAITLAEAGEPMNCQQMVEKVLATGLWQTKGRTPWATLYSAVIREIATKGEAARFRKVDKGKFAAAGR